MPLIVAALQNTYAVGVVEGYQQPFNLTGSQHLKRGTLHISDGLVSFDREKITFCPLFNAIRLQQDSDSYTY